MRAARFHGPGDLRVEDVPDPRPSTGDVLFQVDVALTDGTDPPDGYLKAIVRP